MECIENSDLVRIASECSHCHRHLFSIFYCQALCFPGGSDRKESVCNARDPGSIPGLGRSPGEGNGNPLQFLSGEFHGQKSLWWARVHGVAKSGA